ncbi:MAG: DUF455 family protein [Oligoflexales bacterium]
MELYEYARMILFGANLKEKLYKPDFFTDILPGDKNLILADPKRSPIISLSKKSNSKRKFPNKSSLHIPENRGRVLHFFANHELLALELMALVLLKFPKAPKPFRLGIAKTMLEEQEHLQLYLSRMNQLGVGFGEEHLNDFFWKCVAGVKDPLEFTAKMSLTLEQGNLDFSFYYWKLFEGIEDHLTSAILKQVYYDEIGHVKHGLHWFRKFKVQAGFEDKSDWEVYSQLLDKPLSPIRAKGSIFVKQARVAAEMDSEFISQIEHYQGSKGRPPSIWIFNPNFEEQLLFPDKTFPRTKSLTTDLTNVLLCIANEHDIVIAPKPPSKEFLSSLRKLGFKIPRFIGNQEEKMLNGPFSRIKPWGWTYQIFKAWSKRYQSLTDEHLQDKEWLKSACYQLVPLKKIASKAWAVKVQHDFLNSLDQKEKKQFKTHAICPYICNTLEDFLRHRAYLSSDFNDLLVKAPYGSSGRNQRKMNSTQTLLENELNWLKNTLKSQGKVIVEPFLNKVLDLSVQLMIRSDSSPSLLGITRFLTHKNRSYFGHILGQKLFDCKKELTRAVYQKHSSGLSHWDMVKKCAQFVKSQLQALGYTGPAGMDAFIFKNGTDFYLRPLVEINCRYTMGHCAIALEKHLPKNWIGLFSIKPKEALNTKVHPIEQDFLLPQMTSFNNDMIKLKDSVSAGRVFINDPQCAESMVASLAIRPNLTRNHPF